MHDVQILHILFEKIIILVCLFSFGDVFNVSKERACKTILSFNLLIHVSFMMA